MFTAVRRHYGFSLVEVLVALVVLSVGLLGIAALYAESLHSGRTAQYRTQAVGLATDIADRIRANRKGGASYAKLLTDTGTLTAACETLGAGCAPTVLAANDIAQWNQLVTSQLPGGTCQIVVNPATFPNTYTITITWTEVGQALASSYVLSVQA